MAQTEIDLDALKEAINDMESAINEFDPCYKEFVRSVMKTIEPNNSDFMVSLKKLLRAFADNKVKKSLEAAKQYRDSIRMVYQGMEAADHTISEKVKEGKGS